MGARMRAWFPRTASGEDGSCILLPAAVVRDLLTITTLWPVAVLALRSLQPQWQSSSEYQVAGEGSFLSCRRASVAVLNYSSSPVSGE